MQVSVNNIPKFTPVTISITFENQREIDVITAMMSWNMTIPEMVFKKDSEAGSRILLCDVMTNIHNAIRHF